jgi:hypothetical protein
LKEAVREEADLVGREERDMMDPEERRRLEEQEKEEKHQRLLRHYKEFGYDTEESNEAWRLELERKEKELMILREYNKRRRIT